MRRWFIPTLGLAVIVAAVIAGGLAFTGGGGGATCDRDALAAQVRNGVERVNSSAADQFTVQMPEDCDDDDLTMAVQETTREWHAMPGGVVMRAEQHTP